MIKTEYSLSGGDLLINSNVVSEISIYDDERPPNKTMTRKSDPVPNITAECLRCGVMAVGRVTCRRMVTIATEFTVNYILVN